MDGYSTISLGYIGIYEASMLITGKSHTTPEGKRFAMKIMDRMNDAVKRWKAEEGIGFALYGTPAESLTNRFASIDRARFGVIKDITDKGYYTNSYHVDVPGFSLSCHGFNSFPKMSSMKLPTMPEAVFCISDVTWV